MGFLATLVAALVAMLLSDLLAGPLRMLATSALLISAILFVVFLLASLMRYINLTPDGFSEPIYLFRQFNNWSEVSEFHVIDRKVLGTRVRGVGFKYLGPYREAKRPASRPEYQRFIDASYGDPDEIARLFNAWRERAIRSGPTVKEA